MLAPFQGIEPPLPRPFEASLSSPGLARRALRVALERLLARGGAAWIAAVRERCRARSLFLPPRKVFLRSIAHLTYEARFGEDVSLAGLLQQVDASLPELLEEQAAAEARGAPLDPEEATYYEHVAARAGCGTAAARRVCVALNRLPYGARRAFRRWVLEGRSGSPRHSERERLAFVRRTIAASLDRPGCRGGRYPGPSWTSSL